jgi:hypothetical protein
MTDAEKSWLECLSKLRVAIAAWHAGGCKGERPYVVFYEVRP